VKITHEVVSFSGAKLAYGRKKTTQTARDLRTGAPGESGLEGVLGIARWVGAKNKHDAEGSFDSYIRAMTRRQGEFTT
jgi:hypothetical protein